MKTIALRLAYCGTRYHGWQTQKNAVTVQETMETALGRVCGEPVRITGCGRTDAGVHALVYCASFRTAATIPTEKLPLALNALLPKDVAVMAAVRADEEFNAILSCKKKEYTYKIHNARIRNPFYESLACFYPNAMDLPAMRAAARGFVGTHDFAAVRSVGTQTKTTVRTVYYCEVERDGDLVLLRVCADGFLYNMARAMAGTLLYVSMGKIAPEQIPGILARRDRRLAGPTVPPHGLYLSRIWYDGIVGEMMN